MRGADSKLHVVQAGVLSMSLDGAGTKTCFKVVTGLTAEEALRRDKASLPEEFAAGRFCEDYEFRCEASARTWTRPHAQDNLLCAATALGAPGARATAGRLSCSLPLVAAPHAAGCCGDRHVSLQVAVAKHLSASVQTCA